MPTRSLSGRARCVAALALLFALLAPSTAWAQPAGVVTEDTVAGRARLVVGGTGPIAVTVDGQPQPITTTPVSPTARRWRWSSTHPPRADPACSRV